MIYRKLPEGEFSWNLTADALAITDAIPGPAAVTVHMYYSSVLDKLAVATDIIHAKTTFGEDNRSGIALTFEEKADVACPTSQPAAPDVNVCYGPLGGSDEAAFDPPRRVHISRANRQLTTFSHFLGRALGLSKIVAVSSTFDGNIMQSDPTKRGTHLTLGQVFLINQPLNSALPNTCNPGECPSWFADLER